MTGRRLKRNWRMSERSIKIKSESSSPLWKKGTSKWNAQRLRIVALSRHSKPNSSSILPLPTKRRKRFPNSLLKTNPCKIRSPLFSRTTLSNTKRLHAFTRTWKCRVLTKSDCKKIWNNPRPLLQHKTSKWKSPKRPLEPSPLGRKNSRSKNKAWNGRWRIRNSPWRQLKCKKRNALNNWQIFANNSSNFKNRPPLALRNSNRPSSNKHKNCNNRNKRFKLCNPN
mmetsp:Transcript_14306/g.23141  ORF Transcript_14306/g.23141 Transcript_14306/m.23141 type:complete len:225 (-) Transcript_14306:764-1438(-)